MENRVNNLSSISEHIEHLNQVLRDMRGKIQSLNHQLTILEDQQRQQYLDLDRRLRARNGNPETPQPQAKPGEKSAYLDAFKLLEYGKYKKATAAFQQFLRKYPNGSYSDNAHYWLAETYYVQQNLKAALSGFQTLVKKYPG